MAYVNKYVRPRRVLPLSFRRGLGGVAQDTGSCGADPCTWWDNIYARDACLSYLGCADPNNPLYVMATKGAIVGGSDVLGGTAGASVGSAIASAAAGFEDSITGQPAGTPASPFTTAVLIAGLGLGAILLVKAVAR